MIGSLFNHRYKINELIGQGAMGHIYLAHDTVLQRDVALKLVNQSNIGPEGRAKLLTEAQEAAKLNHPNIVSVYDAGVVDDTPFIVMELLRGKSLFEQKPADVQELINFSKQICRALRHAHNNGVIHRDLKPENIIRSNDHTIKLSDFGLARSVASRLSFEGSLVGTVYYISPESVQGKHPDGRADLYALGVMLYEWATDQLPFSADDPLGVISQHLYAPVTPPHAHKPDIPPALENLILSLLEKRPEDRPASAEMVLDMLDTLDLSITSSNRLVLVDRVTRGRFVGREEELSEIANIWHQTTTGQPQVLLISGEPGIGKTRLIKELIARASAMGARSLLGENYAEGGMPYAPFAQMIQESLNPDFNLDVELSDFVMSNLARIVPGLLLQNPDLKVLPEMDPAMEQQQVFESVVAWADTLTSQTPLVMVLDDAHWSDNGSLHLLRHLIRRLKKSRVLFALTYREIELTESNPLQSFLLDLNRDSTSHRVKLSRFTEKLTSEMLVTMLSPKGDVAPEVVKAIYHETEGNPYYIEEVCKTLLEEQKLEFHEGQWTVKDVQNIQIPQSIKVTIQSRLNRLPESCQDLLRLAAVIGREFEYAVLKNASDLEEDTLISCLENAVSSQILREVSHGHGREETFIFEHALIATTLRESLSGLRRQRLHKKVASAIEILSPDKYERLAYHYEEAGDESNALKEYIKACERALKIHANQEAERFARSALEICCKSSLDEARINALLGEALFRQDRLPDAEKFMRTAIENYYSLGDLDKMASIYARMGRSAWSRGAIPESLSICQEGMGKLSPDLEGEGIAALMHETARAFRFNNLQEEALPLARRALEMAKKLNLAEVQADTLSTIGIITTQPFEAQYEALKQAAELAEREGSLYTAGRTLINYGGIIVRKGKPKEALPIFYRAIDFTRRMGSQGLEYFYSISLLSTEFSLGHLEKVHSILAHLQEIEPLIQLPASTILRYKVNYILLEGILLRLEVGSAAARDFLLENLQTIIDSGNSNALLESYDTLFEISLELDDLEAAQKFIDSSTEIIDSSEDPKLYSANCYLSSFLVELKKLNLEDARRYLSKAKAIFDQLSDSMMRWQGYRCEAMLLSAESRYEEAWQIFEKALNDLQNAGMLIREILLVDEYSDSLIVSNKPEALKNARSLLQEAIEKVENLNLHPIVERFSGKLASIRKALAA